MTGFQGDGIHLGAPELIALKPRCNALSLPMHSPAASSLAGAYRSRFRGRGVDYVESRHYLPGDDIRNMDWRVTNRTGKPHVRVYTEERDRPVIILVDQRLPMFFGSQRLKSVVACEISAALAWAGLAINDRVGGAIFGAQQQLDIKPKRSHHSALQFIHGLQNFSEALLQPQARG